MTVDGQRYPDAAWHYAEPLGEALAVAGHQCFDGQCGEVEVLVESASWSALSNRLANTARPR